MKKFLSHIFAFVLIFAGCTKSEIHDTFKQITIEADSESPVLTKSTASDDGKIGWSEGDKIGVYDAANRGYVLNYVSGTEKSFSGKVSGSPTFKLAISPYNSAESLSSDIYTIILPEYYDNYVHGTTNAPMVASAPAKDDNGDYVFSFKHVAALVKITYKRVPVGTKSLHLKADGNIAGTLSFSTDDDEATFTTPKSDGASEVTLELGSAVTSAGQTLSFYVPVPVANYSYFQVKLTDVNDETIFGTAKKVSVSDRYRRAELHILPTIDLSVVDLGLSVKWASCNLGASSPEESGDCYAWGETETKSEYTLDNYKWGSTWYNLTKYVFEGEWGSMYGKDDYLDSKAVLDSEDDAASLNLGGSWRMPTQAEWKELCESCTWTYTTLNGVNGYKITGTSGNSIFLPVAASQPYADALYWSSSVVQDLCYQAYATGFTSEAHKHDYTVGRSNGLAIRPVIGK